jgi:peptide-methionine (S)-S-oxide reductase
MALRNPLKAYDGYAECVKTTFDSKVVSIEDLIHYFKEIIDPYSINQQGNDMGENIAPVSTALIKITC